jgi:hypothetical protein
VLLRFKQFRSAKNPLPNTFCKDGLGEDFFYTTNPGFGALDFQKGFVGGECFLNWGGFQVFQIKTPLILQ